ncbi:hypothetical protein CEXT_647921 [Caerostris extrusa]|uniref:Uncharacterized protein n=1 Tax=Caerostris extrusa TaxID=172846 RepID=A0AAV4PXC3_CAEEX|nr:hypothetical protein CEXT_647921 [Caerostris extrusa]
MLPAAHTSNEEGFTIQELRKILIREQQNVIDGEFCQIFPINVALVKQPPIIKQINDSTHLEQGEALKTLWGSSF